MTISVGDFAENLLAQAVPSAPQAFEPTLQGSPLAHTAEVDAPVPDISNIEVPTDFLNGIVENKVSEVPQAPVQEVKVVATPPQSLTEVTELRSLIEELKDLVVEVKSTLVEMTTCGSIGVNMASKKETSKDPMDEVLKKLRKKKASNK